MLHVHLYKFCATYVGNIWGLPAALLQTYIEVFSPKLVPIIENVLTFEDNVSFEMFSIRVHLRVFYRYKIVHYLYITW